MARPVQYAKSKTIQATGVLAAAATVADWALGLVGISIPIPVISATFVLLSVLMRRITKKPLEEK